VVARPVVAYQRLDRVVHDPLLPLSDRELEVARLVTRGYSNDEIARALVITPGTAANHVARIMRKLGVRSRTGIGVWTVERGLAAD
jgi:DNA-binding NarL/FixJ family response regulator